MNECNTDYTYVSSRIKNNISHTFECSCYQSGMSVLLNMGRLHEHILVMLISRTSIAHSDVPLLFLLLCFKQHMITTTSLIPTAAMTPMMVTETDIKQYKFVTFI